MTSGQLLEKLTAYYKKYGEVGIDFEILQGENIIPKKATLEDFSEATKYTDEKKWENVLRFELSI